MTLIPEKNDVWEEVTFPLAKLSKNLVERQLKSSKKDPELVIKGIVDPSIRTESSKTKIVGQASSPLE